MSDNQTAQGATEGKAEKAPKAPKQCACLTGTGKTCSATTGKSFAQGHDARMASRLAQLVAEDKMTPADAEKLVREAGGGDLLVSKTLHSAKLRKQGGKPKDRQPKGEAKPSKSERDAAAAALAQGGPQVLGTKVKVSHGKRNFDAVVVRNASTKTVARHRFTGKDCDHEIEIKEGANGPVVTAKPHAV